MCFGTATWPLQVLQTLLMEWMQDPTNKILLFTKSVKLLEMLAHQLNASGEQTRLCLLFTLSDHSEGIGHVKLDGSTAQEKRNVPTA
jgi:hypothetical protein